MVNRMAIGVPQTEPNRVRVLLEFRVDPGFPLFVARSPSRTIELRSWKLFSSFSPMDISRRPAKRNRHATRMSVTDQIELIDKSATIFSKDSRGKHVLNLSENASDQLPALYLDWQGISST
jgi:hypothetical protein